MDDSIDEIRKGNIVARIYPDEDGGSCNPREFDNLGKIVCFHRRYNFPNDAGLDEDAFGSWNEIAEYLEKEEKAIIILPIYLYDHSGLYFRVGSSFHGLLPQGHAHFDSGQIGFVYATREDILKSWSRKKLSKKVLAKTEKCIVTEVEEYGKWSNGEVYWFEIVKVTTCPECGEEREENLHACGGFIGYDWVEQAVKDEMKHYIEEEEKDARKST